MGCRGCRGAHRPCSIQHTRGGRRWEDADGEERAADRRQEPYYPYVPGVERSSSPELRTTRVAVGKRRRGEREESDDEEEVEEEERDELEEDDVPRAEELQVGSSQVEELEVENTVEVVEASPRRSKRVRTVLEIEDAAEVVEASPDRSKRVRMASPEVTQVVPPMEVEEEEWWERRAVSGAGHWTIRQRGMMGWVAQRAGVSSLAGWTGWGRMGLDLDAEPGWVWVSRAGRRRRC